MKEISLRERIRKYLRKQYPSFVNGGDLERLALENGFKASNCSRRARELENDGIILSELRKNEETGIRSVWYQYKQTEHEKLSINIQRKLYENVT